ncbi:hypothetical protein BKA69DRAFT_771068 [Paraphysoderma sedebokerense]|nr:hypothetical protein BKA69DRAFT_771068 [Paraphysoderma sedebokerense]
MISFSRCNRFLSNEMRILYRNSLEKLKTCGESLTNTFIHLLGPLLIGLAVCLITLCTVIFFRVILPYYFEESTLLFYLTCIFSVYLVYCLSFHYYKSVTVTSYSSEDLSVRIVSPPQPTLNSSLTLTELSILIRKSNPRR